MAGLKAKSSSRESRFRKGGGGEGGGGVQQVESPRAVPLNYARGSYHFSFFENNTKRESLFWLCVLTLIFIGWSVFRFKSPENIEGSSSA